MKRLFLGIALSLIVSLSACGSNQQQHSEPQEDNISIVTVEHQEQPYTIIDTIAHSKQGIDTLTITSKALDCKIKSLVAVPDSINSGKHFPVVFLLHGYSDDYTTWSTKKSLQSAANKHGIIIVCPDGRDSWYWDSPINKKMQFETYIMQELIPSIDHNYPTGGVEKRAITGQSMGGQGALYLAFTHPDQFVAAASMSGGVDITKFPNGWLMKRSLGEYAKNKAEWERRAIVNLVTKMKGTKLHIMFDCGSEDFFAKVNADLHRRLSKAGVPHIYSTRPGKHAWKYWLVSIENHLDFFDKVFSGQPTGEKVLPMVEVNDSVQRDSVSITKK